MHGVRLVVGRQDFDEVDAAKRLVASLSPLARRPCTMIECVQVALFFLFCTFALDSFLTMLDSALVVLSGSLVQQRIDVSRLSQ